MNRFANHGTANKLSKTVPLTNPSFTKLAGVRLNTLGDKVEDFAHGSNLRSMVGARMGKVFDLDAFWRFQAPTNFVKLGLGEGTVFDSAIPFLTKAKMNKYKLIRLSTTRLLTAAG